MKSLLQVITHLSLITKEATLGSNSFNETFPSPNGKSYTLLGWSTGPCPSSKIVLMSQTGIKILCE